MIVYQAIRKQKLLYWFTTLENFKLKLSDCSRFQPSFQQLKSEEEFMNFPMTANRFIILLDYKTCIGAGSVAFASQREFSFRCLMVSRRHLSQKAIAKWIFFSFFLSFWNYRYKCILWSKYSVRTGPDPAPFIASTKFIFVFDDDIS